VSYLRVSLGPSEKGQPLVRVTPASAGWDYVGFEAHRLASGDTLDLTGAGREQCLVILAGTVTVRAGAQTWEQIGSRRSVFDGLPTAVYAPAGQALAVTAHGEAEVALAWSPATGDRAPDPYLIGPEEITIEVRGAGVTERRIHPILMGDRPAERLLVVEVLTPAGHWSSYPPHRHERDDPPHETRLEETYYHRTNPTQGFGLQRVYTDDREIDEAIAFADGDVVLVPRGYHPVSAAPGYDLYYLNVMAGPVRAWAFVTDPDHAWLMT